MLNDARCDLQNLQDHIKEAKRQWAQKDEEMDEKMKMDQRNMQIQIDIGKKDLKQAQTQIELKNQEIKSLKDQGDSEYREQLNLMICDHRQQLEEKQANFDHLLENLRDQNSRTVNEISSKLQDQTALLRQKDARIDHLENLLNL